MSEQGSNPVVVDHLVTPATHPEAPRGILNTPEITTAQVVSGIPVIANFLQSFGVYHLSKVQVTSLRDTLVFTLGLLVSDGIIRHGRSTGNTAK